MKIRWTRQSLRLRISPLEMGLLLGGGDVTETLILDNISGMSWSVTLAPGEATDLALEKECLRLTLSPLDRTRLAVPEVEGVYFERMGEPALRYYVEKDFPCVHPGAPEVEEPSTETFVPPPGFQERHSTACVQK